MTPEFVAVHWDTPGGHEVREVQSGSGLLAWLKFAAGEAVDGSRIAVEVGLGVHGEEHPIRVRKQKLERLLEGLGE